MFNSSIFYWLWIKIKWRKGSSNLFKATAAPQKKDHSFSYVHKAPFLVFASESHQVFLCHKSVFSKRYLWTHPSEQIRNEHKQIHCLSVHPWLFFDYIYARRRLRVNLGTKQHFYQFRAWLMWMNELWTKPQGSLRTYHHDILNSLANSCLITHSDVTKQHYHLFRVLFLASWIM